jgi:transcriptional regulator with GAF, ATPase, and Fis domain/tetratricopeptide (TPR) repeat protein
VSDNPKTQKSSLAFGAREGERVVLSAHDDLLGRGGGVVVVTGPRGVGKGTLLSEIRRELLGKGRLVLFGRPEPTGGRPFAALVDPASQALAFLETRGLAESFLEKHAHALGVLLPRLAPPQASGRARDKTAFFESMRAFVLDLARYASLTMLLADVHLADEDTRELIRFLALHVFDGEAISAEGDAHGAVLVLGVRTDDDDGAAFLRTLSELRAIVRHDLAGLSRTELLTYLSMHPALDRLLSASRGRPEDVDDLLASLPASADELALERMLALDEREQRILFALAVLGRPAPPDLVAEAAGIPLADTAPLMSRLVEKGMLARRLRTGELLFTFARTHHLEALLARIPDDQKRALHTAIGGALERRQTYDDANDLVVALHFLNGTTPALGAPFALRACQSLLVMFAYGTAVEVATRALAHAPDEETKVALLGHLVEAYRLKGEPRRALDATKELTTLAPSEDQPKVLRLQGELRSSLGEHKEALALLDDAIRRLPDDDSDDALPERALILAAMADAAYLKGDHERAAVDASRALEAAPTAPIAFVVRVHNTLGKIAYAREEFQTAERLFLDNLRTAELHGLDHDVTLMRINAGLARYRLGNHKDAQEILERALLSARAVGDIYNEAHGQLNLGVTGQSVSDFARSLRHYSAALQLFSRCGYRAELRRTTWNLANVYASIGHWEKARLYLEQSRRLAEAEDSDRGRAFVAFSEGDIAFDEGQTALALTAYEKARAIFERLGESSRVVEMAMKSAWSAMLLGDLDAAAQRIAEIPESKAGDLASARRNALVGASLALSGGDRGSEAARGLALLSRAVDDAERHDAFEDAWRMLAFLGDRYDAQGDSASAAASRARARLILLRMGERLSPELYEHFARHPLRRAILGEPPTTEGSPAGMETIPHVDEAWSRELLVHDGPRDRLDTWNTRYVDIIGESPPLLRMFERLDRITRTHQSTVLIRGESGTGKELVAGAIHRLSERKEGAFVRVNCAALVETLLLSELFGHEKGSFTGAFARKIGRFELARGGTIFLDEIGDISPKTQVSLLRVLQERSFERVGGTQTIKTDAVVICATHRDLESMVAEGTFREDLYYRLRGVVVEVPALRERPDDIKTLVARFLAESQRELGRAPTVVSAEAEDILTSYAWPGNIRELQNIVRSVALFCEGDIVERRHLTEFPELFAERGERRPRRTIPGARPHRPNEAFDPPPDPPPAPARSAPVREEPRVSAAPRDPPHRVEAPREPPREPSTRDVYRHLESATGADGGVALGELKRRLEFEAIANAMRQTGGNVTRAAALLQMKRPRLSQIVNADPDLKAIKERSRGAPGEDD